MAETFTSTINSTTNALDMNEQETMESIGADEIVFYNSIRADLDLIAIHPKADTIQNILDHSINLR
ncbi:MAG: hypothetical protein ABIN91_07790 [Mucilaginibacter sp.]|uniref:hypothetical protein n=1 Tax=Mucilaginibacter sp. TaxID=1882438 RepID=UPI003266BBC3